jgi:4-carboxymuconolactone decarboxylase
MPPNDRAQKHHEELFPNHKSTLKATDPELIEVFDNFAFDEVIAQSNLDTKTRVMLILAAIIGANGVAEFKVMAAAALTVGVTPVQLKEIVYQSVPYVGMAKAFDFIHAANDVLTSRGIQLPVAGQSTTDPETRREQGLAAQKAIFGCGARCHHAVAAMGRLSQDVECASCAQRSCAGAMIPRAISTGKEMLWLAAI